jgi:hypothetical protein
MNKDLKKGSQIRPEKKEEVKKMTVKKSKWDIGSNINAILQAKIEAERTANDKKNLYKHLSWFRPEVGVKYSIRFLPLILVKENYDLPWFAVKLHRNLIEKNKFIGLVCPKSVGVGECPVCEYINENYADAKDAQDTARLAILNQILGSKRYYSVIYNRNTKSVEKIEYSETLKNQIIADINENNPLEFTNLLKGYDGKIIYSQGAKGKTPSFMFSEISTPLASSDAEIEKIVNEMLEYKDDILRLIVPPTYDKLKELLNKYLRPSDADDEDDTEDEEVSKVKDEDVDSDEFQNIIDSVVNDEEIPF